MMRYLEFAYFSFICSGVDKIERFLCEGLFSILLQTSFLTVTVYIEDINDHTPKFLNLPYTVYVDEATPVGTAIYQQVAAFDRDKPNTPNSDVQYTMGDEEHDPGGSYFSLESPHRPSVILRRQLDFDEGKRMFEIPIIASVSIFKGEIRDVH